MRSYFLETVFTENTKTGMNTNIRPLTTSTQQTALMATSLKQKFRWRFIMDTCITYVCTMFMAPNGFHLELRDATIWLFWFNPFMHNVVKWPNIL